MGVLPPTDMVTVKGSASGFPIVSGGTTVIGLKQPASNTARREGTKKRDTDFIGDSLRGYE
jgi:hypothetical protein